MSNNLLIKDFLPFSDETSEYYRKIRIRNKLSFNHEDIFKVTFLAISTN